MHSAGSTGTRNHRPLWGIARPLGSARRCDAQSCGAHPAVRLLQPKARFFTQARLRRDPARNEFRHAAALYPDSAYADVRLLPFVFALALLAIRPRQPADIRFENILGALACAFFLVRVGSNTASLAIAANDQRAKLEAFNFIPVGARVASFYVLPHAEPWALPRDSHLGGW